MKIEICWKDKEGKKQILEHDIDNTDHHIRIHRKDQYIGGMGIWINESTNALRIYFPSLRVKTYEDDFKEDGK